MSKTYGMDRSDAYRAVEGVWESEGAYLTGEEDDQTGSLYHLRGGGDWGRYTEVTTHDAAADAKFRAECERQGIPYQEKDWT